MHPLATSEGGDGDGEGSVDDWPTNQIKAPDLNTLFSNSDRFLASVIFLVTFSGINA